MSTFAVQKQPTPRWIILAFIGVPCIIILALSAMLIKNLLRDDVQPDTEEVSVEDLTAEVSQLHEKALALTAQAKELSVQGNHEKARAFFKEALTKLAAARRGYAKLVDCMDRRELPPVPSLESNGSFFGDHGVDLLRHLPIDEEEPREVR